LKKEDLTAAEAEALVSRTGSSYLPQQIYIKPVNLIPSENRLHCGLSVWVNCAVAG